MGSFVFKESGVPTSGPPVSGTMMSKAVDIYKNGHVLLQLDKITHLKGFPRWFKWFKKAPPVNAGAVGLIPGLGRSPGVRNGNPLQYSCLENSMDRETSWATLYGVAKSGTQLRD